MEIWSFPKSGFSLASALIILLFFLSCRLFALMYSQIFFTISVLGIGLLPITSASAGLGVKGAMKAAFAFLGAFLAAAFLGAAFFGAAFLAAAFLGAAFFAAFFGA